MTEGAHRAEHVVVEEIERGLHLHHHLSPRRERAMFASLGFFVALALTRGITTWLHYHGAGANGGKGRESVEALAIFAGFLLWAVLIAPFARAAWRYVRAR